MEQEKKQAVALMRYSAIAPLITGTQEDYESLSAYFRTVSAKGSKRRTVLFATILRELWKNGILPTANPALMLWFPPAGLTAVSAGRLTGT